MLTWPSALAVTTGLILAGCPGPGHTGESTIPSSTVDTTPTAPPQRVVPTEGASIHRNKLVELLGASPGAFFSQVDIEAAFQEGRFIGWRLANLPPRRPGWLDLRRGDVVTAVNGQSVERPDDAMRIWETLRVATEVYIEYRQSGETRNLRIPVVEDEVEVEPSESHRGDS